MPSNPLFDGTRDDHNQQNAWLGREGGGGEVVLVRCGGSPSALASARALAHMQKSR